MMQVRFLLGIPLNKFIMRLRYSKSERIIANAKAICSVLFMMASILGAVSCFSTILFGAFSLKLAIAGLYFTTSFLFSYNLTQKL